MKKRRPPSRKRNVTFKRRNDGANLLMDAAGASILKSMGHDDDLRAARTLSRLGDGRMNSRRYSPTTHSMGRILSMPSQYVPPPTHTMSDIIGTPHSIGRILDDVNYPRGSGYPPFNPHDPPAYLYRDINPGVVPRGPSLMKKIGGMDRSGSDTNTSTQRWPDNIPVKFNSAIPKSSRLPRPPARVNSIAKNPSGVKKKSLRKQALIATASSSKEGNKTSSAGKCGGGRRRGTRRGRSGARRTRRARR